MVDKGGVGVERREREKESGGKGGWEGEEEDLWLPRVRRRLCRLMLCNEFEIQTGCPSKE
jgi:hypothetical protein